MRPNDSEIHGKVYECFVCGTRAGGDEGRTCPDCGSELRHIGRPRDL